MGRRTSRSSRRRWTGCWAGWAGRRGEVEDVDGLRVILATLDIPASVEPKWPRLGRIATKTETVQGVTTTHAYGYDARGRLATVHTNGTLTATWGYDPNGNRISQVTPAGTTVGLVDDQDRLLAWGAASFAYDANGDLTTRTDSAGLTNYDYDLFGNLRRVDLPSGDVVEYLIDGQNRRVGRVVNGAVTHKWLYKDQLNPVAELDAAGNVVARFIYGTTYHAPDVMLKGGATYRIVTDHLGSVRLVVNVATGAVAQRLDYDEWGRVLVDTNPGFQPFGYAGGLYDPATGLVRFGVRDYDAEVGRWTAKDPIRFAGGVNFYTYVGGNPIHYLDYTGLAPGDRFLSPQEASLDAVDWARERYPVMSAVVELAAWIVETVDPCSGAPQYFSTDPLFGSSDVRSNPGNRPSDAWGVWHTHLWDAEPSKADEDFARRNNVPVITIGPDGDYAITAPR